MHPLHRSLTTSFIPSEQDLTKGPKRNRKSDFNFKKVLFTVLFSSWLCVKMFLSFALFDIPFPVIGGHVFLYTSSLFVCLFQFAGMQMTLKVNFSNLMHSIY